MVNCSSKNVNFKGHIPEKERLNLTRFFDELLIEHSGIYTLWGRKPMTVEGIFYYDENDMKKIKDYLEKNPAIESIVEERFLDETWLIWKDVSKNFAIKNFIFAEIKPNEFSEKESLLLFINVKETSLILQKYYSDFKKAFGKDFHPLCVISDLSQGKDDFWKTIFENRALLGILLGYGYNNSWLFKWKNENNPLISGISIKDLTPASENESRYILNGRPFKLPSFAWFDRKESRKILKKYDQQRKEILKIYKNRDFLDSTLEKLCE